MRFAVFDRSINGADSARDEEESVRRAQSVAGERPRRRGPLRRQQQRVKVCGKRGTAIRCRFDPSANGIFLVAATIRFSSMAEEQERRSRGSITILALLDGAL